MKRVQHVRANLAYYVAYFAAKPRVTYFCTDHAEEAIRMRLVLERLGCSKRILLLYACAPELADLYARYDIELWCSIPGGSNGRCSTDRALASRSGSTCGWMSA